MYLIEVHFGGGTSWRRCPRGASMHLAEVPPRGISAMYLAEIHRGGTTSVMYLGEVPPLCTSRRFLRDEVACGHRGGTLSRRHGG